ncbi:MAG: choice-of-anchor V domain-containing protein [Chitinophagales bacterium]
MNFRKFIISFSMTTLTLISIIFYKAAFSKEDGAPSANTNSPDDGRTCARDSCHTGEAKPTTGLLTANVAPSGFKFGDTLTFTMNVEFPGRSTFGFQASPQTIDGDKLGEIIVTDDFQTKTTSAGKYITHEKEGIDGSDEKTWNFDWVATSDVGEEVTFYYAVNAADGDGEATGDSIYYGSFTIFHDPTDTIPPLSVESSFFTEHYLFQNPVLNDLNIVPANTELPFAVEIFDVKGMRVFNSGKSYSGNTSIQINFLERGVYFLRFFNGKQYYLARFVKG